jgi:hypothetical protein
MPPTLALKRALREYLEERKMLTDEVVIVDGIVTPVAIDFRYSFDKAASKNIVEQKVQSAINSVFTSLLPGKPLRISKLYEAVESIPEIESCYFVTPKVDIIPANEFELLSNTVQLSTSTFIPIPPASGDLSFIVDSVAAFADNQPIMLLETGKVTTVAKVERIEGKRILLREDTPVATNYTIDAKVLSSTYHAKGWQFERIVDAYIRCEVTPTTESFVNSELKRKTDSYFRETLLPEEVLVRSKLLSHLQNTFHVSSISLALNGPDSSVEIIDPASNEKLTLGMLFINGITV